MHHDEVWDDVEAAAREVFLRLIVAGRIGHTGIKEIEEWAALVAAEWSRRAAERGEAV